MAAGGIDWPWTDLVVAGAWLICQFWQNDSGIAAGRPSEGEDAAAGQEVEEGLLLDGGRCARR